MPDSAVDILLASLATQIQYAGPRKKWSSFYQRRGLDPYQGNPTEVLSFLTDEFNAGATYGTLNSARSVISLLVNANLAGDKWIARFFKGIFRLRPPRLKYDDTWDAEVVIAALAKWWPLQGLSLLQLTKRLVTLLALGSAQRGQTLHLLKLEKLRRMGEDLRLEILDLIKGSRPGKAQPLTPLRYFREEVTRCIATNLDAYLAATTTLREEQRGPLFLTTTKPHKPATRETLRRWVTDTLLDCGIDQRFRPHSTRHAVTSTALRKGADLPTILKAAGWSQASTFAAHYHRPVRTDLFSKVILRSQ